MRIKSMLVAVAVLTSALVAPARGATTRPVVPEGYRLETIRIPENIALEVGGLAFHPSSGDLYIVTRFGEAWIYRPGDDKWTLFADGLHQPLGISITPDGKIFVAQRPELTELIDRDGDHRADTYRTVSDAWGYSGNYHEFAFGPVRDSRGNFYISLNLSAGGPGKVDDSIMGTSAPYRGWCVQVTPDGTMIPFASGLRSPAGIGISPADEIFITDNQGDWVSTSCLFHVEKGKFYGHPASLAQHEDFRGKDLNALSTDDFEKRRTLPAVWFPHYELARSPGDPIFDTTNGQFGPFAGQMFLGDQGESNIVRVSLEKVGGAYQGVAFEFVDGLASGPIRAAFAPDGRSLWIGQTGRGWGTKGGEMFALQRIVYDGRTIPHAIETIRLTPDGFKLVFTKPVDRKAATELSRYAVRHWEYKYQAAYVREQKLNVTTVETRDAMVAEDGKSIELKLPDLKAGRVYEITADVPAAADGSALATKTGFYTLNHLLRN